MKQLKTDHAVGDRDFVTLSINKYNELGQLQSKDLHTIGATPKQKVDYRYNIRGWLTRINDSELSNVDGGPKDYFGMNLGYNENLNVGTTTLQYNGNISAIKYSSNQGLIANPEDPGVTDRNERGYVFSYDAMNRLTDATHVERTLNWSASDYFNEDGLTYDMNGNIRTLNRGGGLDADDPLQSQIDQLTYFYKGNQLNWVTDALGDKGFKDGNKTGDDYLYDKNGNLRSDANKDITAITYNYLNLPYLVTKGNGDYVKYIYSATGEKLSQEVYSPGLTKKSDYIGEFFYENGQLQFINTEEGRVVMADGTPEYQYMLKDHLGNNRITFTTKPRTDTFTATLESATQSQEENDFSNYSSTTNDLLDHTDAGTVYSKALVLNGGYNGQVGLTRSFAVVPGDVVEARVYAKYVAGTGPASNLNNFAVALSGAFGLSPVQGEGFSAYQALNGIGSLIASGDRDDDDGAPKGFVNILVFDKNYTLIDFAYEQIGSEYVQSGTVKAPHQLLTAHADIKQPGYVYVFLSNEGATEQQIGFDDLTVEHSHSDVVQAEEYYPFGLTFNSYQAENSIPNLYQYNGKEIQDEVNLGWMDYGVRMYKPELGRWNAIDPIAAGYFSDSPYSYALNNPTTFSDVEGAVVGDPKYSGSGNVVIILDDGDNTEWNPSNLDNTSWDYGVFSSLAKASLWLKSKYGKDGAKINNLVIRSHGYVDADTKKSFLHPQGEDMGYLGAEQLSTIPRSGTNVLALTSMSGYLADNATVLFTACGACQNNSDLPNAVFSLLFGKEKNLTLLMNGSNTSIRWKSGKIRLNASLNERNNQWRPWSVTDSMGSRDLTNDKGNWLAPGLNSKGFSFFDFGGAPVYSNGNNSSNGGNSSGKKVDDPYHPHKFHGKE